jgi:hypothetical protein
MLYDSISLVLLRDVSPVLLPPPLVVYKHHYHHLGAVVKSLVLYPPFSYLQSQLLYSLIRVAVS